MESLPRSLDSYDASAPDAQPILLTSNIATFTAPERGRETIVLDVVGL